MKKIYIFIASIIITVSVFAQSPEKMSYQAVIRDASNNLITNTTVGMQISILQGNITGNAVYTETHPSIKNNNGLISIEIGTGTTTDDFSAINWGNDTYFIKTETDPTGGTTYTISGTSQLLSVPYALHAKTAENFTGTITETDPAYTASQASNIKANDIIVLGNTSGINTGDQDLSNYLAKEGDIEIKGTLEVEGSSTNKTAYDAGSSTTIDFSKSNLAYTTAEPSSFTLTGIKDGGSYTLAVRGTTSEVSDFTAAGFTFKSKNNGNTLENSDTLYTFLVMGTTVYFSMTAGL